MATRNPERWIDVKQVIPDDVSCDWEGFANGDKCRKRVIEEAKKYGLLDKPESEALIDIVTHVVYENYDKGDYMMTRQEIAGCLWGVHQVLSCRYFLKYDAQ